MIDFTLIAKWKTAAMCFFFVLLISFKGNAQNKTITGKVVDGKTNETLIGATVQIKGTTTGKATDLNGSFSIRATEGTLLEVKSIGYATVTVPVDLNGQMLKPFVLQMYY